MTEAVVGAGGTAAFVAALSMRLRGISRLPTVARYAAATAMVGAVLLLARAFPGALPTTAYMVFFPVLILCAIIFDHGTSIYATLLATAAAIFFIIEPATGLPFGETRDLIGLAIFVGTSLLSSALVEALRHAVDELSKANAELLHVHAEAASQVRLLSTLVEQIPDPIYVKDRSRRYVYLNSAAARLIGLTPEKARQRTNDAYLPAAEAGVIAAHDGAVMTTAQAMVFEEVITVPGERPRTFLSTRAPWLDGDGQVIGVVGVTRDIDARKAAETSLKAADAQKQVLLYDINHRIKNHLQSIVGLMSVASRRARDLGEAQTALSAAGRRLAVLGQVYNRLQVNDGHPVVDTRSFIDELCADLRATLVDTRPIRFDVAAVAVEFESNRAVTLGLIVNELVQNALKYAFPDGRAGVIAVTLAREGETLVLTVADDGIGIDEGAEPVGTGMGQRLIGALVQQLGGVLGRGGPPGTSVTVRFPVDIGTPV